MDVLFNQKLKLLKLLLILLLFPIGLFVLCSTLVAIESEILNEKNIKDHKDHYVVLNLLIDYLEKEYNGIKSLKQDYSIALQRRIAAQAINDATLEINLSVNNKFSNINPTISSDKPVGHNVLNRNINTQLLLKKRLFDWGYQHSQVTAAQQRLQFTQLNIINNRQNIYFDVIKSYYTILLSIAKRNIRKNALESLMNRLDEVRKQVKLGVSTSFDLAIAEASLAQGQNQLSNEKANYQSAISTLSMYIPEDFENLLPDNVTMLPSPPISITSLSLDKVLDLQQQHSKQLAILRQQVAIAESDYKVTQNTDNPALDLTVDLSHQQRYKGMYTSNTNITAAINFYVPLISNGVVRNKIGIAQKTLAKQKLMYYTNYDQQIALLQRSWHRMNALGTSIQAAKCNLIAQKKLLIRAEHSFIVDQLSLSKLLDQQDKMRDAQIILIETQYQFLLSVYYVIKLIGLSIEDYIN